MTVSVDTRSSPITEMLADLYFLIAALDRRVPRLERSGEAQIAHDAAELRERAVSLIRQIEGATPKDGPSAGIAITTSIVSAMSGIPVRSDVAMTGEITLRGEVLAIGGLKEKLLAAHRGGIKTVLIPEENVKDLAEIPDNVKNRLEIVPVKWIDKVLEVALERQPVAISDEEAAAAPVKPAEPPAATEVVKH